MPRHVRADLSSRLSFWTLVCFLMLVWIAGGASRSDAAGQVVVRFSAWTILIGAMLALPRFDWREVRMPIVFVGLIVALTAIQLIPLPPALWTALPGREVLTGAAAAIGEQQPWRPLSISPSATANALGSLIVPVTIFVLIANLTRTQHWRIAALLLGLTVAGSLLGLLQFSGVHFDHPLVNDTQGLISANFANRNHFALFLAIGCVVALVWAFERDGARWKMFVGTGTVLLLALMILATGSRMGMVVGTIGVILGLMIVRTRISGEFKRLPRKAAIALALSLVILIIGAVWLSIGLNRAVSIERILMLDASNDLRTQITPVVFDMIARYLPVGAGFGTFDPAFRMVEPDNFLRPSYFNRAHNDWLEIVLDGGLAAALLLAAVLVWFVRRSLAVWRRHEKIASPLPQVGSAIILLVLIASVVDYPARTPMVMAILAVATAWLATDKLAGMKPKGGRSS